MSVLDKFMDMMRLNDDYDDEYYDDDLIDEEYEEDPKPRRLFGRRNQEDFAGMVEEEEAPAPARPEKKPALSLTEK